MFKLNSIFISILVLVLLVSMSVIVAAENVNFPDNWLAAPTASEMGITQFKEAPMLQEMVENGEIPPVGERLPDDPLVIKPLNEIGKYGGEISSSTTAPNQWADPSHGRMPYLFTFDPSVSQVIPEIAKDYEIKNNSKTVIIYLREGLKWSDGHPFTVDDIMFWYEDEALNKELPQSAWAWQVKGETAEFEKIDEYTLKIEFAYPHKPVMGKLNYWITRQSGMFDPKHHLKQFHIDYNPDANELAKEEGYESWVQLFNNKREVSPGERNKELPVLGAWMLEKRDSNKKVFVRNPYYWAVDTEGNQLPYADRWSGKITTDQEVAILEAMQGNIDFAGMILRPGEFPMYKENESEGNYEVRPWKSGVGSQVTYGFNLNHPNQTKREIFQNLKFRQAMSLAIDREEINQFAYLGMAEPAQVTVDPKTSYFEEWWAQSYAEYKPEEAKKLLDEINLVDQDGDGWRDTPDGENFIINLTVPAAGDTGIAGSNEVNELVVEYWQEIGIKTDFQTISRELYQTRIDGAEHDVGMWNADRMQELRVYVPGATKFDPTSEISHCRGWGNWWDYQQWKRTGEVGAEPAEFRIEPPQHVKDYFALEEEWYAAADDEEYIKLGQEVWSFHADNLWLIGTVARPVRPVIINNRLKNVPQQAPLSDGTSWWRIGKPAQWFIEE